MMIRVVRSASGDRRFRTADRGLGAPTLGVVSWKLVAAGTGRWVPEGALARRGHGALGASVFQGRWESQWVPSGARVRVDSPALASTTHPRPRVRRDHAAPKRPAGPTGSLIAHAHRARASNPCPATAPGGTHRPVPAPTDFRATPSSGTPNPHSAPHHRALPRLRPTLMSTPAATMEITRLERP